MNLSFFIAARYFKSKSKTNFITVLSRISMIGVAVGTMALVTVLSVFNGLEDLIKGLFSSFDAEIKIEAASGKSFETEEEWLEQIRQTEGVEVLTEVIEDMALFKYREYQHLGKLKGVGENFYQQGKFTGGRFWGERDIHQSEAPSAILGRGVGFFLSVDLDSDFDQLEVYYPKAQAAAGTIDPRQLYARDFLKPVGFFSLATQFDDEYVIAPLAFVSQLLNYGNRRSALEIKTSPDQSVSRVKKRLKNLLGEDFLVKDAEEQHAGILQTIRIEKLFVFITLTFILAVASFNIFFSLSLLAIEKKKDVAILKSMGAKERLIRNIFIKQGAIIAFSGTIAGLVLGFVLCWLQDSYGLVSLGVTSSVMEAYPVKMIWTDFLWTSLSVIVITFLAAIRPAIIAAKVNPVEEI